jgi:hypothetical protein
MRMDSKDFIEEGKKEIALLHEIRTIGWRRI